MNSVADKSLTVRSFKKRGITHLDRTLQQKKADEAEARAEKRLRRNNGSSLEDLRQEAEEQELRNDTDWMNPAEREKCDDLNRLIKKTFWKAVPVKDGFFNLVDDVLPFFRRDVSKKVKTQVMLDLEIHLDLLMKISTGDAENTLSPEIDLDGKTQVEILSCFIRQDKANLAEKRSMSTKSKKNFVEIMTSCGTDENDHIGKRLWPIRLKETSWKTWKKKNK